MAMRRLGPRVEALYPDDTLCWHWFKWGKGKSHGVLHSYPGCDKRNVRAFSGFQNEKADDFPSEEWGSRWGHHLWLALSAAYTGTHRTGHSLKNHWDHKVKVIFHVRINYILRSDNCYQNRGGCKLICAVAYLCVNCGFTCYCLQAKLHSWKEMAWP